MFARIVLLFALVAVCGGCGASDEEKVQQVVRDYNVALGEGDVDQACSLFAEEYWSDKRIGCKEFVQARSPTGVTSEGIVAIQVAGDTATATGSTHGDLELRKIDGDWKLTSVF
jgi:hypothetical protein